MNELPYFMSMDLGIIIAPLPSYMDDGRESRCRFEKTWVAPFPQIPSNLSEAGYLRFG